jgi:hypothetical protein
MPRSPILLRLQACTRVTFVNVNLSVLFAFEVRDLCFQCFICCCFWCFTMLFIVVTNTTAIVVAS